MVGPGKLNRAALDRRAVINHHGIGMNMRSGHVNFGRTVPMGAPGIGCRRVPMGMGHGNVIGRAAPPKRGMGAHPAMFAAVAHGAAHGGAALAAYKSRGRAAPPKGRLQVAPKGPVAACSDNETLICDENGNCYCYMYECTVGAHGAICGWTNPWPAGQGKRPGGLTARRGKPAARALARRPGIGAGPYSCQTGHDMCIGDTCGCYEWVCTTASGCYWRFIGLPIMPRPGNRPSKPAPSRLTAGKSRARALARPGLTFRSQVRGRRAQGGGLRGIGG